MSVDRSVYWAADTRPGNARVWSLFQEFKFVPAVRIVDKVEGEGLAVAVAKTEPTVKGSGGISLAALLS